MEEQARKLLDLTLEYQESVTIRRDWPRLASPAGREPSEVAEEYVATLRALLNDPA
ncbi:hypothetical protein [Blastococcus mobilis]|uniref:Uncharacterized protein n=1 Tax=Blastococcus mobilis TaxID=1938746 RepID=A0A238VFM7_9ACTN|nr:hypothetical protein [Blastococcus mobilis]SNR32978.1 hypothetical protein SAMN06272737_10375 [Blastococcus mobilis]